MVQIVGNSLHTSHSVHTSHFTTSGQNNKQTNKGMKRNRSTEQPKK